MLFRFTHNWALKLTALVLAIALWSHVRGQVNPWENATFKARLKVETPRGFVLLNARRMPADVTITLRGPRLALRALKGPAPANPLATGEDAPLLLSSQARAMLDLSNPHKGEQDAPVKVVADLEDIEVVGVKPSVVTVELDAAETRRFNIRPTLPAVPDLIIERATPSTPRVEVSGLSSQLDRISRVRAQVAPGKIGPEVLRNGKIELSGVPLLAVDARGAPVENVRLEPESVNLRVTAREKQEEKTVRVAVTTSGDPVSGYAVGEIDVLPETLKVRGPRRILEKLNALPVKVDIKNYKGDFNRRVAVDLPDGVEAINGRRVRVRVVIEPNAVVPQAGSTPSPSSSRPKPPAAPARPPARSPALSKPAPPTSPVEPVIGTFSHQ
jgi:YbbR domain-containing protein